ncbi:molybdate ABC transporter substrate-binding protein [Marinobacter salinexigens]|uniref:Molybdate ABC transporter substrate-binding protein n=1 Tax=Marinobacter salinexigens TaxID=2919747 RepID=A0A5B0VLJ9_9GAMM|nr:molybdate ABC transporter substrate-binding protein [Marinobacter salinexigens]KAA1175620.1 molybdate ABC transporter substrate-binding protein [Marinobacter salinexigens]
MPALSKTCRHFLLCSGVARSPAIILSIALASFANLAYGAEVRIAVAANFTDTTRELISAFEETSRHRVTASYGSTGKLYAQIEHGAPFDVFLAADSRRPRLLEENGQGVAGTRFTYAKGKLALWSPVTELFDDAPTWLSSGDFRKLAIANPKTAPYGAAAEQVLNSLGLWTSLQPKLVRGDSIAQTFQFVATDNAEAGFVALSQVRAWENQDGTLWPVPQDYYAPIEQQAILLTTGAGNPAAKDWLTFLHSEAARAIIEGFGYDTQS